MKRIRFFQLPMFDQFHWLAAWSPLIAPLAFYTLVCHAALLTGEWPSPEAIRIDDMRKTFAFFGFHSVFAFLSIIALSLSPIAWLMLLSQAHLYPSLAAYGIRFAVFLLNLSFCLWLGFLDPGGFLRWFLD